MKEVHMRDRGKNQKSNRRRHVYAGLALGMLLALTACGKGTGSAKGGSAEVKSAESGKAEAPEKKAVSNKAPVSLDDAKKPADKDFIYDKFNDYVELRGYQGKGEVILIPSTIEGLPVVAKEFSIKQNPRVRGIIFDEGYTRIPYFRCESSDNSPVEIIKLPSTCTEFNSDSADNPFVNLPYLRTIEVEEGNTTYYVEDGILYANDGNGNKILLCYPPMREGENFTQPDDTRLAEACFANTTSLKRVENAKPWVGKNAFRESSVEEVVCSEGWTSLDQHDFEDAPEMRSITLSVNLKDMTWKVDHFERMDKLEEIVVPEGNEKFFSEDGVLYYVNSKQKETYLVKYPNAHPGEEFTVSEKATNLYRTGTVFENPIYLKRVHVISDWEDWAKHADLPNGIEVVVD